MAETKTNRGAPIPASAPLGEPTARCNCDPTLSLRTTAGQHHSIACPMWRPVGREIGSPTPPTPSGIGEFKALLDSFDTFGGDVRRAAVESYVERVVQERDEARENHVNLLRTVDYQAEVYLREHGGSWGVCKWQAENAELVVTVATLEAQQERAACCLDEAMAYIEGGETITPAIVEARFQEARAALSPTGGTNAT